MSIFSCTNEGFDDGPQILEAPCKPIQAVSNELISWERPGVVGRIRAHDQTGRRRLPMMLFFDADEVVDLDRLCLSAVSRLSPTIGTAESAAAKQGSVPIAVSYYLLLRAIALIGRTICPHCCVRFEGSQGPFRLQRLGSVLEWVLKSSGCWVGRGTIGRSTEASRDSAAEPQHQSAAQQPLSLSHAGCLAVVEPGRPMASHLSRPFSANHMSVFDFTSTCPAKSPPPYHTFPSVHRTATHRIQVPSSLVSHHWHYWHHWHHRPLCKALYLRRTAPVTVPEAKNGQPTGRSYPGTQLERGSFIKRTQISCQDSGTSRRRGPNHQIKPTAKSARVCWAATENSHSAIWIL